MRFYIGFLCLCVVCLPSFAQKLDKFYIQALHDEGRLYFVLPQKMQICEEHICVAKEKLQYDFTYLDSRDSVDWLMTVTTDTAFKADSLKVEMGGECILATEVDVLYCNPVKKNWQCRLRCIIPYEKWLYLYKGDTAFLLTIYSSIDDVEYKFEDNASRWSKLSSKFRKIHQIIRLNRDAD